MNEHGAARGGDAWREPALGLGRGLIDPQRVVIRFAKEKHAADPGQSWLFVRDRELLRELMLALELVRANQVDQGLQCSSISHTSMAE